MPRGRPQGRNVNITTATILTGWSEAEIKQKVLAGDMKVKPSKKDGIPLYFIKRAWMLPEHQQTRYKAKDVAPVPAADETKAPVGDSTPSAEKMVPLDMAARRLGETLHILTRMDQEGTITIHRLGGKPYVRANELEVMVEAKEKAEQKLTVEWSHDEQEYAAGRKVALTKENPDANSEFYIMDVIREEVWMIRIRSLMAAMADRRSQDHLSKLMTDARTRYDKATQVLKIQPQQDKETVSEAAEMFVKLCEAASGARDLLMDNRNLWGCVTRQGETGGGKPVYRLHLYPFGLKGGTVAVSLIEGEHKRIRFGEQPIKPLDKECVETET